MATVALDSAEGRWVMAAAIMASAMAFIDGSALNVVLPSLQQALHASGADIFWILNAYLLMLAALILVGGSLGDKLGRKKIFGLGILIFIAGSGLCGIASNVFFLVLFRILQGIGGALMIPGSLSLISSSINEQERGSAIGTWSAITTVVTVGGPILGGALADAGLWRYIFFLNIPIGILAFFILATRVKEVKDDGDQSIDVMGAVTIALGLAAVTFGFLRIPHAGFHNWQVYASLAAGVLLLAAFLLIEFKGKHPMMPLKLFSNRTFSGANLLTFFLYAGLGAAMLFLSLNLVQVQGYSQLQSGLTFLPFTLLMITLARFAGRLADKWGPRWFLTGGPLVAGCGMLLLAFVGQTRGISEYWTTFFPGIVLFGLGMSCTVAPLTATVMGSVSDHLSGTASGINNALTRISNVFANAVFGALAVVFFTGALQSRLEKRPVHSNDRLIMAQAADLGNAKPPAQLDAKAKAEVQQFYHQSFLSAYRRILLISAALCFTGALLAALMVKDHPRKSGKE